MPQNCEESNSLVATSQKVMMVRGEVDANQLIDGEKGGNRDQENVENSSCEKDNRLGEGEDPDGPG